MVVGLYRCIISMIMVFKKIIISNKYKNYLKVNDIYMYLWFFGCKWILKNENKNYKL